MTSYCEDCDEFFNYSLLKNKKYCPTCDNELKYYRTLANARRLAPVKARCMHCKLFSNGTYPEDITLIKPLYHKACEKFVPEKGVYYRG